MTRVLAAASSRASGKPSRRLRSAATSAAVAWSRVRSARVPGRGRGRARPPPTTRPRRRRRLRGGSAARRPPRAHRTGPRRRPVASTACSARPRATPRRRPPRPRGARGCRERAVPRHRTARTRRPGPGPQWWDRPEASQGSSERCAVHVDRGQVDEGRNRAAGLDTVDNGASEPRLPAAARAAERDQAAIRDQPLDSIEVCSAPEQRIELDGRHRSPV